MDHVEEVPQDEIETPMGKNFYLPHHCVFKEASSTTKLRVVFDGSAKTSSGASINDALMVGPVVQDDLFSIILRFRFYKIALSADIAKMYRQVVLRKQDRDFHRFLWFDEDGNLKHYRFKRVIYGISCAAHLSTRCLKEIAKRTENPHVSYALSHSFYVDDFLAGANSVKEAEQLVKHLYEELLKYGFPLRKWSSSHPNLIKQLPPDLREENDDLKLFSEDYRITTLGISWKPNKDIFTFNVDIDSCSKELTKRNLLSITSKLFDPMGWLSPVVIQFKILMQQTWVRGLQWDERLPDDIATLWNRLKADLSALRELQIPRAIVTTRIKNVQIHVFSDASEKAFAAVIYSRVTDTLGNSSVKIISSKTKVSPVKTVSLPRLELCAAHLAAKLCSSVQGILQPMELDISFHAWTDSTIVLQWLSQLPRTWSTFVANRVSSIQQVLPRSSWKHVRSTDNPADIASRGLTASEIIKNDLWWNGPSWLAEDPNQWPTTVFHDDDPPEKRQNAHVLISVENDKKETPRCVHSSTCSQIQRSNELVDLQRFSSFDKLVRVISYVVHFALTLLKRKHDFPLHPQSQRKAKFLLLRMEQRKFFTEEYSQLKKDGNLAKKAKLRNLTPFIDTEFGVIRVGGRLGFSNYHEDKKFPTLISKRSLLVPLIIRKAHEAALHGGGLITLNLIRQEFWITNARPLVNNFIKNCIKCFRFNTKPPFQLMADLPRERVTPSRPFSQCGIDFAGPFRIKSNGETKVYISMFICMSTKAVHMEIVSGLSKTDCTLGLERFIARRGLPARIFSDNGNNFLGARNDLIRIRALLDKDNRTGSIANYIIAKGCEWLTIPPRAPHFGGLWEAAIKSMKRHMRRVIGLHQLTYEEFATVVNKIEAVLNSRPLIPLSSDPNDPTALTPAHFLIGDSMLSLPDGTSDQVSISSKYKLIQKMNRDFWTSWRRDYLTILQIRKKWFSTGIEFRVGDLVLLADDNESPMQWKTARILEVYPGNDDIVRVCKVKTAKSEYLRPVVKLRRLPLDIPQPTSQQQ